MANAASKQVDAVESGLASIIRPAALFLTNKENFVADNGDFAGTETNSDRQLWSVAAMLAIYHRILMGISFENEKMEFSPVIPESFRGPYSLSNFRYRNGTYDITVKGWGDGISSFRIDGNESSGSFIPATMTGSHKVEITMNGRKGRDSFNRVPNYTAPATPVISADGEVISWGSVAGAAGYRITRNGKPVATVTDTVLRTEKIRGITEYQVMAVDSNGIGSFLSNPVTIGGGEATIKAQAEDFNIRGENSIAGFSGKGYVRFTMANNRELVIRVYAEAGKYALRMRYANGTGPVNTDNNCAIRSLFVNGSFYGSLVFPQRGKDEWSDWGLTFPERIDLKEGENILAIRYEDFNMNMDGEINEFLLDCVSLEKLPEE